MDVYSNSVGTSAPNKRLARIIQNRSWAKHYGSITLPLRYFHLNVGDQITLQAPESFNGDLTLRIISIAIDTISITLTVEQISAVTNYYSSGSGEETGWGTAEIPNFDSVDFELLPKNTRYGTTQKAFFSGTSDTALRQYLADNSTADFKVLLFKSDTETGDYQYWKTINPDGNYDKSLSADGELKEDLSGSYPESSIDLTGNITERFGINVENMDYEFSIDCGLLVKIDDEYIYATAYVDDTSSSIYLDKYQRAVLGSKIAEHTAGSVVKIYKVWKSFADSGKTESSFGFDDNGDPINYENIIDLPDNIWLKAIWNSTDNNKISDITNATPFQITESGDTNAKSFKAWTVGTIKVIRAGTTTTISWNARSSDQSVQGAGVLPPEDTIPQASSLYGGSFLVSINGGTYHEQASAVKIVNTAVAFTIGIKQKDPQTGTEDTIGDAITINVSVENGTFINGIKI